jgi:general secretion pathway protein J
MLFSALTLASRSWEAINNATERSADLRIARQLIERSVRQLQRVDIDVDDSLLTLPAIAGDQEHVDWVASLSSYLGMPGLYLLRLTLEVVDNRTELVLYRWLAHPDVLLGGDDWPAWNPLDDLSTARMTASSHEDSIDSGGFGRTVLVSEVERFEISYFGRRSGESEETWSDEWLDQPNVPAALRIELTTPALSWAPLFIRVPGQ